MFENWLKGKKRPLKCAAVTPVGPGHVERALECRASIEAAWREDRGPFTELEFCFIDDSRGELGRSKARNLGVEAARRVNADWIFFLDADDLMTPRGFAIFADCVNDYDAVWGLMAIKPPDGEYHIRFPQALSLRSVDELLLLDPFMTLLMGHFVRTEVARTLPFDETMDAGEDFDYYIRAWGQYRCTKLTETISVNRADRHSTGPRSATADQWRINASARLERGRKERALERHSTRAIAALNRVSEEAQAFSRARGETTAADLPWFAGQLPHRGFVDVSGVAGGDFVLFNNNDDPVALHVGWLGEYQPATSRLWQQLCGGATAVADVGAGSGYYTLLAARAGTKARVCAAESLPAQFSRLQLNCSLNEARNVEFLNAIDPASRTPALPDVLRIAHAGGIDYAIRALAEGRSAPDIIVTLDDTANVQRLDEALRARGYRWYEIDEEAATLTPVATAVNSAGNRWATARTHDKVKVLAGAAYCGIASAG